MEITEQTKIFINNYGIFYEGQVLEHYDNHNCYIGKIELKKFIVHYVKINKFTKIPKLYFNMSRLNKTLNFTLSAEHLGIYYRIPKKPRK